MEALNDSFVMNDIQSISILFNFFINSTVVLLLPLTIILM